MDARNGFATLSDVKLAHIDNAVTDCTRHLSWVSWHHVRRGNNKMADYMASVAMDSQASATIDRQMYGTQRDIFNRTASWVGNDMSGLTSRRRATTVSKLIKEFRDSQAKYFGTSC